MSPLSAIRPVVTTEAQALLKSGYDSLGSAAVRSVESKDVPALLNPQPVTGSSEAQSSFSTLLGNFVQDVNSKQVAANQTVQGLMSGENVSLHQAVIAMEEASLSFQLMVEVRNKLVESYQELMRMQV